MTTPNSVIDTVRALVADYFSTHITDERDDALARLRQAEDTATHTVRQVAADTTGADRRATQEARDEAVAGAERVGSAESVTQAVAQVREDRVAAEGAATESATSATASAESARQAAESALSGLPDGGVTRIKLAPEVIDELNSKATATSVAEQIQQATPEWDSLQGKPDTFPPTTHQHTMAQITDLPEVTDQAVGGALVQRDSLGNVILPRIGGDIDQALGLGTFNTAIGALTTMIDDQVATRVTPAEVDQRIEAIIDSAPENLDTLGEIAVKLKDQDDVAAALTAQIAGKADRDEVPTTAADVGARPDTWVPTAAQVGARPASWTPTAAQVGAATPAYVDQRIQLVTSFPTTGVAGVLYLTEED